MSGRTVRYAAIVAALGIASLFAYHTGSSLRAEAAAVVSLPKTAPYAAQKVVYHVSSGGGWFGHDHRNRVQSMENHVAALPAGALDMAVVLQGDGLDLLRDAKSDTALATRIDGLRARGVRFLICRNTLMGRGIGLDALEGARAEDVVGAGVAEVTRLQQLGYAYLRM